MRTFTANRGFLLLTAAANATLLSVAITTWSSLPRAALLLYLLFAAVYTATFFTGERQGWVHAGLAVEIALLLLLFWLNPRQNDDVWPLLFALDGQAALLLPLPAAIGWIALGYVLTLTNEAAVHGPNAIFGWLAAFGGHIAFAAVGYLLRRENQARQQTQLLLDELQAAHAQLQDFAAQSRQLAVAEERNRLAREIHDSLGHRLIVAVLQLEGAQRLIDSDPARAASVVGTMRAELKDALGELRAAVSTLRTPLDHDAGEHEPLEHRLLQLTQTFQEATGLPVHVALPPQPLDLPQLHTLALYRAAQEMLTNVQRHAAASQAQLCLEQTPSGVSLTVTDDGRGLPDTVEDGRFGLRGLRERVSELHGELSAQSRAEGGTEVCFVVPLNEDKNE